MTELHLFAAIGHRTHSVMSVPIPQGDPASSRAAAARILDALTAGNVATVAAVTVAVAAVTVAVLPLPAMLQPAPKAPHCTVYNLLEQNLPERHLTVSVQDVALTS